MSPLRPSTLQSKFLIGVTIASLLIGGLLASGLYFHVSGVLEQEIRDRAAMVFSHVDAIKGYVREQLRPRMYEKFPENFVIEAMSSSFISRSVMDRADGGSPHVYRRVSKNARNPAFEANTLERELIERFQDSPGLPSWEGYKDIDGERHFVMARPVRYREKCLYCHGDPADAPDELVEIYGDRGFGHQLNSIGGVDVVGLPVTASVARVQETFMTYLMVFVLGTLLFFGATSVIFKSVVVNNIRTLALALRKNFSDDEGRALLKKVARGDEIDEMIVGVEQLGEHLYQTRAQLQDYAANLEDKVGERTRELSTEHDERQADVTLFVDLLRALNQSQTRPVLWRNALPLVAQRFGLSSASYICTFATGRHYSWPDENLAPELPDDWVSLLIESRTLIDGPRAFVPIESSESSTEGLLCLVRADGEFHERDRRLLQALGRQLGIAAENLAVFDNVLRHSANLQAIFEGISDPLILLDESGGAIIVNAAARELAMELTGDEGGRLLPALCADDDSGGDCGISVAAGKGETHCREITLADRRSFALRVYPVRSDGPGRVVLHVRETTSEKKMLAQVTRSEKLATGGKLSAGLAHEINNPLGVILCYAELLRKGLDQDAQREDLDVIVKHTRQAQRVLNDLLNFARPTVSTDEVVDVGEVAGSVASVFGLQAAKKRATITARTEPGVSKVQAEPHVIEHITANLLLNALDAVPEGSGRIVVSTANDPGGGVVLTVTDNGSGIAEADLPQIFDPFYTTKEVNQGTGLGLTVIYGFMADLGGSVEAENVAEGGARFIVRFPAADAEEAA